MIDDCEPWEFHNEGRRRAAKEHRCGECRRTIAPGETYEYGSGKCDGYFSQWKTCLHCLEASRWLSAACNGYLIGAVDEDLRHHIRGGEEDYLSSRPLIRLVRWMAADWRDRSGDLRDVEVVREVTDRAVSAYRAQYTRAVAS